MRTNENAVGNAKAIERDIFVERLLLRPKEARATRDIASLRFPLVKHLLTHGLSSSRLNSLSRAINPPQKYLLFE